MPCVATGDRARSTALPVTPPLRPRPTAAVIPAVRASISLRPADGATAVVEVTTFLPSAPRAARSGGGSTHSSPPHRAPGIPTFGAGFGTSRRSPASGSRPTRSSTSRLLSGVEAGSCLMQCRRPHVLQVGHGPAVADDPIRRRCSAAYRGSRASADLQLPKRGHGTRCRDAALGAWTSRAGSSAAGAPAPMRRWTSIERGRTLEPPARDEPPRGAGRPALERVGLLPWCAVDGDRWWTRWPISPSASRYRPWAAAEAAAARTTSANATRRSSPPPGMTAPGRLPAPRPVVLAELGIGPTRRGSRSPSR